MSATEPDREQSKFRALRPRWPWFMALFLAAFLVALDFVRYSLPSYALLKHFSDPQARGPLLRLATHEVTTEEVTIPVAGRAVPARLYLPLGVAHPTGMAVVHGIHHLGMDEPRLVRFSRAVAGSGLVVLTPQVDSLADYHVDATSIAVIGEAAAWLDQRTGGRGVTVTGISFAGGLALLAATQTRYASHLRALVLVGAYDDLARVSRFLATGEQELPNGQKELHPAHDYGASVFVYAHLDQFFPESDRSVAHEALRDWLWEEPEKARSLAEKLSPRSRATLDALLNRRIDEMRPQILRAIRTDEVELAALSPHGRMANLHLPVYILHGSADNIIPPAESLWLAHDLPHQQVRQVLITGAFSHVDPDRDTSIWEELRLVYFISGVLRAAK